MISQCKFDFGEFSKMRKGTIQITEQGIRLQGKWSVEFRGGLLGLAITAATIAGSAANAGKVDLLISWNSITSVRKAGFGLNKYLEIRYVTAGSEKKLRVWVNNVDSWVTLILQKKATARPQRAVTGRRVIKVRIKEDKLNRKKPRKETEIKERHGLDKSVLLKLSRKPMGLLELKEALGVGTIDLAKAVDELIREGSVEGNEERLTITLKGIKEINKYGIIEDIIQAVGREGLSTIDSIADRVGMSRGTVSYLLEVLKKNGIVSIDENGRITLIRKEETNVEKRVTDVKKVRVKVKRRKLKARVRRPISPDEVLLASKSVVKDEASDTEILYVGRLELKRDRIHFKGEAATGKWIAKYTKKGSTWEFEIPISSISTVDIKVKSTEKLLVLQGFSSEGIFDYSIILDPTYVRKYLVGTSLASSVLGVASGMLAGGIFDVISDKLIDILDLPDRLGESLAHVLSEKDPYQIWLAAINSLRGEQGVL